ncbi:MAG: tRNA lysidine(34) synthetase TilS [Clostridia bacterium]|nr:tRNA lysidine(34) synthetase TilS [Clostridia bacterium]
MSRLNLAPCAAYAVPWKLAGLPKESAVLLALSGGADSRVLLDLLHASAKADGFRLLLAHVNHGIRGDEAARDEIFCRELAAKYGYELCVLHADVPALAKVSGRGLEEEARSVRYSYFEALMRERQIPILVTAHHADDHLETLLFRLSRGAGLAGLCGIAPSRAFAGGYLVRPLLHCTRREILTYCEEKGLEYVTDSTNADPTYARNRIRAEILPVLESLFEGVGPRAVAMSEELCEDEAYLTRVAEEALMEAHSPQGLQVDRLRAQDPSVLRRVLRLWFFRVGEGELSRAHVNALCALLFRESESGTRVALPNGCFAVREFGCLRIERSAEADAAPFCLAFAEGETLLPASGIRILVKKCKNGRKIHNLSTQSGIIATAQFAIIKKDCYWRSRREGDRILQGGMHKQLRRLYNAAKVPARWRDALPLLCDGEGIVWAPFVGCRDGISPLGEGFAVTVLLPDCETKEREGF